MAIGKDISDESSKYSFTKTASLCHIYYRSQANFIVEHQLEPLEKLRTEAPTYTDGIPILSGF